MAQPIITSSVLSKFAPKADPAIAATIANGTAELEAAGITTPLRAAHFLAQVAIETGGLSKVSENMNYSRTGLRKTFGRHRISDADCAKHGRTRTQKANQEAIANLLYGGRWGKENLGNMEEGDGWRFRGGGMLQTTGRANYRKCGHENDPNTLRTPEGAFRSALKEWKSRGCNALADRDDVTAVRKSINGGTIGLEETKKYLKSAKKALGIN
jgi:putative chitinase